MWVNDVIEEGITTFSKYEHCVKQPMPKEVTEEGISILSNLEHP